MSAPRDARAILEERARRLARPVSVDDGARADDVDLLVVRVGGERLAVPLAGVVSLARVTSIAPLPRAVPPVYGVTAWRGRPLTVLSLATGRPAMTAETRLVVLGAAARASLAVVVDAVDDTLRVARARLAPPGDGPRRRYALGVTPDGLLVVSTDALLDPEALGA